MVYLLAKSDNLTFSDKMDSHDHGFLAATQASSSIVGNEKLRFDQFGHKVGTLTTIVTKKREKWERKGDFFLQS